ncbi:putative Ovochymase-2 [Hypsibius exemplaris]|uniref:Ovochymase-2 n=1 Tax=Hypsibius exemplaris TaxID=2072580 RepID=A0A9X6RPI1_HYPEX|nr:putative Ovochymase-2 [Hypsibius exemplaris]
MGKIHVRILAIVPDGPPINNQQVVSISTCGGSIIGSRTILTAAHCLFNTDDLSLYSASFLTVRIGARNDAVGAKPQGCEKDFKVTRAFPHPGFRPTMTGQKLKQTNNDIALLTLAEDIDFANSPCACPLCLEDKVPEVGAQCIANGVGVQNNDNAVKAMQYAQLDVKDALSEECLSAANKEEDNSLFVCAGGETRGTSTCQGDSGGPLACLDANGKFYSAGVSSYAVTNCPSTRPAHFSKTQRYLDWIRANAEQSQLSFV